jgi:mannose-6-phosphate isomerase-like protein (cupin superfamily)
MRCSPHATHGLGSYGHDHTQLTGRPGGVGADAQGVEGQCRAGHGPRRRRNARRKLDGYSVSFVTIRQGHDLAPMLKRLPDDRCQCPHWGYVFKGRLIWRFADHEEVSEAGDAFYVGPGHAPEAATGSEFVQFSPAAELAATMAEITRNMPAIQTA